MRRARALEALGWVAFGLALLVESWRMPRLESLHIEPWSAPGLLPGVVGVLMALFGVAVYFADEDAVAADAGAGAGAPAGDAPAVDAPAVDAPAGDAPAGDAPGDPPAADDRARSGTAAVVATLVLCLGYAGGLVGHGVPFVVASAVFIGAFVSWFRWPAWRHQGRRGIARGLATAVAIAVVVAVVFASLFESVFLVRLP